MEYITETAENLLYQKKLYYHKKCFDIQLESNLLRVMGIKGDITYEAKEYEEDPENNLYCNVCSEHIRVQDL